MATVKAIDLRANKSNELVGLKNLEYLPVCTDTKEQEIFSFLKGADVFFYIADSETARESDEKFKSIVKYAVSNNIYPITIIEGNTDKSDEEPHLDDIRNLFTFEGNIQFAAGIARGENKVEEATNAALKLNTNADGVFIYIVGSKDTTLDVIYKTCELINDKIKDTAEVVVNTIIEESMPEDILQVAIITTGCK